jgi:hypothetical protein
MAYRQVLFKVVSVFSILIAAYHFVGIFYQINQSGFVKRPKYFVYIFLVLTVQQFYSHGSYFFSQWFDYNKVDWISLFLLVFLPIIFFNLILDLIGGKINKSTKST